MTISALPASPSEVCEVCGGPLPPRRPGPGRRARYCRPACRQAAYRERQTPDAATLRELVMGQLDAITPLDVPLLRAALDLLAADQLAEVHRQLGAVMSPLAAIARILPPAPDGRAASADVTPPVSVTAEPVTISTEEPTGPVSVTADGVTETPPVSVPAIVGGMRPTEEQAAIIGACASGANLVIVAGAGTGKTSSLRMAASVMRGRGLYIAFNRAIASEAKRSFPGNVSCSTAHSLAYRAVGYAYKQRLDGPRLPARETARLLGIDVGIVADGRTVEPVQLARLVMDTIAHYCRSADAEVMPHHVPQVNGIDSARGRLLLADLVVPLAVQAWTDLRDPGGKLRFQHDHYLKLWALTNPQLEADFILFDEAQDADPLIASVVQSQRCQLVAVGDSCQAIYHWRGAIDALETWPATERLYLTQSWRFGPAVAEEANKWLRLLKAPLRLSGTETVGSRIGALHRPRAVLCRSNAEAIQQVMAAMADGRRAALVGGGQQIKRLAQAALDLQSGRGTDHPELFAFRSWPEVQQYAKEDDAGGDLRTLVRLVDDVGAVEIIAAADALAEERYADVVVSTAHKAKGREWPTVRIASDFRQPKANERGEPNEVPRGEAMLAYVAVTRAREQLDRGGLAWIDDQLAGRVADWSRERRNGGWDRPFSSRDEW